jgi:predicted HTH transcriptional regulator
MLNLTKPDSWGILDRTKRNTAQHETKHEERKMTDGPKRQRKTRKEMIAATQAKLEKLLAQEEGTFSDENENDILKGLKRRLRKTETALKAASLILFGADGKSTIEDKIVKTRQRLASQIETCDRAEAQKAALPFDIERLSALIDLAEAGEDVEFPNDLTRLTGEQEKTPEEHEAKALLEQQEGVDA